MLRRRTARNGVVFYASPLLEAIGVPHGFSTRVGGVSASPFDSLNLGNPNGAAVQDDEARIAENYRRLHEAIGSADRARCWAHQVHGNNVIDVCSGTGAGDLAKADALVTDDPTKVMSVRIADCVPVLISTTDGKIVAAVHAGWRGVIAGIVPAALQAMRTRQSNSQNATHPSPTFNGPACGSFPGAQDDTIVAAIGPCISGSAFEVGPEVLAEFDRAFGTDAGVCSRSPITPGKGHVDLPAAVRLQLLDAGISPQCIDQTDRCTVRDREEFFSHRRDDGVTGRMAAMIAPVSRFA